MVGTGHLKCMQLNNHSTNNNKPNSNKNTKKTSLTPIMIVAQSCPTLWARGLYSPWNPLGQATGVGSLSLLQRIFLAQGLKPGLLHCRQILYQLSHKESPRILEWVAYPLSRDLPDPGIELGSPALQVDSLPTELSREAPTPIIRNYRLGFILFIYFGGGLYFKKVKPAWCKGYKNRLNTHTIICKTDN